MVRNGVPLSLWHLILIPILVQTFITSANPQNVSAETSDLHVEESSEKIESSNNEKNQIASNSNNESAVNQLEIEHAALSAIKEDVDKPLDTIQPTEKTKVKTNETAKSSKDAKDNSTETSVSPVTPDEEITNKTSEKPPEKDFLPEEGAAEKEHSSSLAIFFVLFVIILCIFLVHSILQYNCHHIPESLAIVFLGALVGLIMKWLLTDDFKKVESFSPTMFFLVLLPPIIFESGYNLHKGKKNIYSVLQLTS